LTQNVTADIRAAIREGRIAQAEADIAALLLDVTGSPVADVRINFDQYSLNSVNGFAQSTAGEAFFFKFHQEDGEEDGVAEYYNAAVLKEAGYPVEQPLFQENRPGRQVLVYRQMADPRFSDVCSDIEKGDRQEDFQRAISAQVEADKLFSGVALKTLEHSESDAARQQSIFQLFYNRLVDDPRKLSGQTLAGRVEKFYLHEQVNWPGISAPFQDIWMLPWTINGIDYPLTIKDAFDGCLEKLSPLNHIPGAVVTAHGDAHNANVWFHNNGDSGHATLSLFDPAFAGREIPALLAEVKASFHNIFAHPFWLYEPECASDAFSAEATIANGRIRVETDYALTPLREAFLVSKADNFWRPLVDELARRGWLAPDWEATVRMAFFACPTLVMKLLCGPGSTHNPSSSLIGFCQAMRAAGAPTNGEEDMFVRFFDRVSKGSDTQS
tara:strand:+ start:21184 stop:22506 length:1323 start_codon:yes stop_codon:yes gene_type:complete